MTKEERHKRSKSRRKATKKLSERAYRVFISVFNLQEDGLNGTPTDELAALCKAANKISRFGNHVDQHLAKRAKSARKSRGEEE